jgi:ATP-binding cassette subfamily F protein uup
LKTPANAGASSSGKPAAKAKLSFNETRELEQLPARIEALEAEQQAIQKRLAEGSIYASAPEEAKSLAVRLDVLGDEIDAAMTRWEALELKRNG